jgi:hypothetical protein
MERKKEVKVGYGDFHAKGPVVVYNMWRDGRIKGSKAERKDRRRIKTDNGPVH